MLLPLQNYDLVSWQEVSGKLINATRESYFIASIVTGLAIPFLLLRISEDDKNIISVHGMIGMLLFIFMLGIACFYSWNISRWYLIGASALYSGVPLILNLIKYTLEDVLSEVKLFRILFGWFLASIFLLVGLGLHFKDGNVKFGFFIVSIAAELAIPYLRVRGSK